MPEENQHTGTKSLVCPEEAFPKGQDRNQADTEWTGLPGVGTRRHEQQTDPQETAGGLEAVTLHKAEVALPWTEGDGGKPNE